MVGKEEEGVTYSFSQEGMRRKEKEEETVPAHQVYFFSLSHSACVPESIAPQYSHTPPRKNNFFFLLNGIFIRKFDERHNKEKFP